ncbi:HAD hydrolase-like protein [Granulicella sp. dw_53]|uniref:HAD hydrolase-like protein n=1 Tax=Granulicella sp. dw_53 TaxID=2719792 RepID=UPI001BD5D8F1|nr:HAD hydrolase-like protein [Granulicella sp. dw_53]
MTVKPRLVIFDLDGTIADTLDLFLNCFNKAADIYSFSHFDEKNMTYLRSLDARQILSHHHVPLLKVPSITRWMRKAMAQQMSTVSLFPGVENTLKTLHEMGLTLAMLTSNSIENVTTVLGLRNLARFNLVECGTSIFGKAHKLRRLVSKSGYAPAESLYVGDEIRDIQAAKRASVPFIAAGYGYTLPEALLQAGARRCVAEIGEISELIRSFPFDE